MTNFDTEIETFDDSTFSVFKTRWGTYAARDADGKGLCSGIDRDAVIFWAREHLNGFKNSTKHTTDVLMKGDMLK